jgi:acetyl-CoA carboxylase carboxyltransferase component
MIRVILDCTCYNPFGHVAVRYSGRMTAAEPSASNRLVSRIDVSSTEFRRNATAMAALVRELREQERAIGLGGGATGIERQHAKGRLTARERIRTLIDPGTPFFELGILAAFGMYEEWGGAPAGAVVTGIGTVCGRQFMVIANDATVKAGAFFPITCKKVLRAQIIALENRIPTIYLVDSSGIFLPLQEDVFPDQDDFGRVYYHNALMSARGVPQMAAIMGNCVAGGAYLPVMCDTLLMTEGSGLSLAGPALVKAAIGQEVTSEELGGARMHAAVSGTIDFREPDDPACLRRIRALAGAMGDRPRGVFDRQPPAPPAYDSGEIHGIFTNTPAGQYDVRDVIARVVDRSEFEEYRAEYGLTLVCGTARINGFAIGIVANQRIHIRRADGPMEFGGVIYAESADKAARFMMQCNQHLIPLVFLHDVSGFMVGKEAEASGIIRAGAKMVNVVSNSVVPKITVIMGGSFGAGNYALCGKAFGPRFIFAWPTAQYAVMAGAQAAKTLADIKLQQLEREGKTLSARDREALTDSVRRTYAAQMDAKYAAARLWVDKIIDPAETRSAIGTALEIANLNPDVPPFNVGVLQV